MAMLYKCGSSLGKMLHFHENDAQTNLKISLILQWILHNLIYSWKKSNGERVMILSEQADYWKHDNLYTLQIIMQCILGSMFISEF